MPGLASLMLALWATLYVLLLPSTSLLVW